MADYSAEMDKADANKLSLVAQRLQNQQAQQGMADDQSARSASIAAGGDTNKLLQLLQSSGNYKAAQALQKSIFDNQKTQSEIGLNTSHAGKFNQDVAASQQDQAIKLHDQHLQQLQGVSNPDEFMQWVKSGVGSGALDLGKAAGLAQQLQQDPTQFDAIKEKMLASGVAIQERFKQEQDNARNALTNQTHVQTTQMSNDTSRANTAATNATHVQTTGMTQAGENSRSAAQRATQMTIAGLNPDGSQRMPATGADGQIDLTKVNPADLAAAYRYKTDGTLPPNMGRGVQGAAEGLRIRTIASALDSQAGESPEDARVRQLALKGDVGAINQMRKREIAVGANVKNFDFNADQALQLSAKVDRSGVPLVNSWINAGRRSVTGNPDLSAFDVAVKTTVNEFAQIVSGTTNGATTEGEKKKAEALLNAAQTPEQVMSVINQMKVESRNRMASFAAQRAEAMPTNKKSVTPAAGSAPKTVNFSDLKN